MNADHDVKEKFRSDSLLPSKNSIATGPSEGPAEPSMTTRFLPLLLLALASTAAADPRGGRDAEDRAEARERMAAAHQGRAGRDSLAESVRRVERATGGQILSAERIPFDGRDMNRIKVVDATGRVRVITEDPQGRARGRGADRDD